MRAATGSEGLTTFMADYAYKAEQSAVAAREMRLGWLRDFAALPAGSHAPRSHRAGARWATARGHGVRDGSREDAFALTLPEQADTAREGVLTDLVLEHHEHHRRLAVAHRGRGAVGTRAEVGERRVRARRQRGEVPQPAQAHLARGDGRLARPCRRSRP